MTVFSVAEATYVMRSLEEELRRISKENGYHTAFVNVERPSWSPDQDNELYARDAPSLFLWTLSIGEEGGGNGDTIQERNREMEVVVIGLFSQQDGLQEAMLNGADDVDKALRSNPQRNFPGSTGVTNTWGIDTVLSGGFSFDMRRSEPGQTWGKGTFAGRWTVKYRAPM